MTIEERRRDLLGHLLPRAADDVRRRRALDDPDFIDPWDVTHEPSSTSDHAVSTGLLRGVEGDVGSAQQRCPLLVRLE